MQRVLPRVLLALILVAGFALRVWHNDYGLPYVWSIDEGSHFANQAVEMFWQDLDPGYYENPAAYTYLLYGLLRVMYGPLGSLFDLPFGNVTAQFSKDPTQIWEAARTLAAFLCMVGVAATYWAARRLWGVREGLVAAAVLSFAFLPVAYSRVAVTDVGALTGVAVALYGAVRAYEDGRLRDYAIAGAGAGLAGAFKYTAGLALLPLAIAALARLRADRLRVVGGLALGVVAAGVVFVALNPFVVGSFDAWWDDLSDQAQVASDQPKPGQEDGGVAYYLDSLTWGLGWVAALAALAGAAIELRRDLVRGLILVALPLALFAYLSIQARYFGRWLLPAYPVLAMLAAVALVRAAEAVPARRRGLALAGLAAVALAQPVAADVRSALVLGREDTRVQARDWLEDRYPPELRVAIEPAVPGPLLPLEPLRAAARVARALPRRGGLGGARVRLHRHGRPEGLRPVQARPVRPPRRRRARVGVPPRAAPERDRRPAPLRLLPRHDPRRGARASARDRRPRRARLLRPPPPRRAPRARVQPLRPRRRARAVQLRPLLQLLPHRIPAPRADGAPVQAARLPAGLRRPADPDPEGARAAAVRPARGERGGRRDLGPAAGAFATLDCSLRPLPMSLPRPQVTPETGLPCR